MAGRPRDRDTVTDFELGQLDSPWREVLLELRTKKLREAADFFGIPIGTLKSRMNRAMTRVHKLRGNETANGGVTESHPSEA